MRTFPLRRVGAGLGVATATALAIVAATPFGVAAPSPTHTAAARDAATWLAGEYTDGVLPGPFTPEDWGLSIDGVIALAATGVAGSTRQAATAQIAAHVRSYNSYDDWGLEGFTDGVPPRNCSTSPPPPAPIPPTSAAGTSVPKPWP